MFMKYFHTEKRESYRLACCSTAGLLGGGGNQNITHENNKFSFVSEDEMRPMLGMSAVCDIGYYGVAGQLSE